MTKWRPNLANDPNCCYGKDAKRWYYCHGVDQALNIAPARAFNSAEVLHYEHTLMRVLYAEIAWIGSQLLSR